MQAQKTVGNNIPNNTNKVGLLNPAFKYTNAASTDIRKTFDRIRQEQQTKLVGNTNCT